MTRTDTFFSFLCGGCGVEDVRKTRAGHGGGGGGSRKMLRAKYGGYT